MVKIVLRFFVLLLLPASVFAQVIPLVGTWQQQSPSEICPSSVNDCGISITFFPDGTWSDSLSQPSAGGTYLYGASGKWALAGNQLTINTLNCSINGISYPCGGSPEEIVTVSYSPQGVLSFTTAPGTVTFVRSGTGNPAITVTRSGNGSGTVTSSPAGINCGTTCTASYSTGASVTLTAAPGPDSTFSGWSGACSGTGACSLSMDIGKSVTASFTTKPFVVKPEIVITATSATVSTQIVFNPSDVGKQGSVFVTGWVPLGALATLGIPNADASLLITSTPDNPDTVSTANLRISKAKLAETDAASFVLVQLTASGWQLVVNGQLIPYATGVLGDALAAQSILNNADPSKLAGAQLCVGYGTTSTEMVASGRMLPVASIATPTATGSCNVAANPPRLPYTGLFWNASESGWGMSITQHASGNIFAAWYVYDANGKPIWYVMPACSLSGKSCTSDIYSVVGGMPLGVTWSGTGIAPTKVGSGTLSFSDNDTATYNYSLNGVTGSKNLTRQPISTGTSAPLIDYSDLWWNANESGWGVSLSQQFGMIFVALYTYDAKGQPIWYVASSCPLTGNNCTGTLYQVTGDTPPTVTWNSANQVVTPVGSISFIFTDGSIGTMQYTINGVAGTKAISRQSF